MMNKVTAVRQSLVETGKNFLDKIPKQQQVQSASNKGQTRPSVPKEVFVISKPGTTFEVIVKTEGHKSGSAMVSRQAGSKPMEEARPVERSKSLRDQNRPALRQGVQQLVARLHSPTKNTRHENLDRRDARKPLETHRPQKYSRDNKLSDEMPTKRSNGKKMSSEKIKTAPNSGVPSTTTIASSMESIEVKDRQVQCGGIFDRANDRFGDFDPIKTIGFLMKEMESLVRDERSSKILTDMEQALLRISIQAEQSGPMDLDAITLRAQLDAATAKLAESSAKIESMCAAQREEIESLLQQVHIHEVMLKDAKQREKNLENESRQLKMELNDAAKTASDGRRAIAELQKETETARDMEKLIADLRRQLNEQMDLSDHRLLEKQYLQLEKEKLVAVLSYKDSQLIEHRTALKELRNYISEQLIDIRETGKRLKDPSDDHQPSIIQGGGAASSSLNSSCSVNSMVPASCIELSEISLSTVDCYPNSAIPTSKPSSKPRLPPSSYFNGLLDDSENCKFDEKTQLEFISLPGGEISHPISVTQRKDDEANVVGTSHNRKDDPPNNDRRIEAFRSVPNLARKNSAEATSRRVDRENKNSRSKSKTRKSSSAEKRRSGDSKSSSNRDANNRPEVDRGSGDPATIKQQFEMMFEDIRKQSKLPVREPSPPRDYPHPEWSDSSLPTNCDMSESNIV